MSKSVWSDPVFVKEVALNVALTVLGCWIAHAVMRKGK